LDGGKREAAKLGLPLLGQIPMDPRTLELADQGKPVVLNETDSEIAKSYRQLWSNLTERIGELKSA
jgi:ATP-binding protein involved in chromosome partitioning